MQQISERDLATRLSEYPRSNYTTIFSVMKGVVLANAAIVVGPILQEGRFTPSWLLWIASFLAVVLTYQAAMIGTIIIAWRPKYREVVLSFLLGIVEFGLFSLCDSADLWPWLLCFAVFSAVGGLLAFNACLEAAPSRYVSNIRELIRAYAREQRTAASIAGVSTVFWLVSSFFVWRREPLLGTCFVLGGLAVSNMIGALIHQHDYMERLSNSLETSGSVQLPDPQSGATTAAAQPATPPLHEPPREGRRRTRGSRRRS